MKAIEIETEIDEHHEIHIKLPDEYSEGKARVIVLIDKEELSSKTKKRTVGQFRGRLRMSNDFDESLPDDFGWLRNNENTHRYSCFHLAE